MHRKDNDEDDATQEQYASDIPFVDLFIGH